MIEVAVIVVQPSTDAAAVTNVFVPFSSCTQQHTEIAGDEMTAEVNDNDYQVSKRK